MRKPIKSFLSLVGLLVFGFVAYIFYLDQIGPTLVGPKPEVDAICQAIEPRMTHQEISENRLQILQSLDIASSGGPNMSYIDQNRLQVDIHHQSGFVCICQVDMADGVSASAGEVFCVD